MSVSLTPAAARHVAKSLAKRGSGIGLRLAVKTSGCNGFAYGLEFVDVTNADDTCFENHGVKVIVDPVSLSMLAGTQLDFVREGLNEGFKFNNPNATANCGCGESFSV
ncbi:iron-sulfur cluster assembly protein IscA [Rhodoferax sp.]|uniref:iron-sulfur cluster assembly protein IscA n=1 Tax=Rhodoferax sp. TaxID=50421 RepID=UPI00283B430D|nr:iron-sulfur cluster assembly protein IscA [Rhodoferax sp.]MDR3370954.1 iron-sulfur cluster assembly protein IscA [Rhodoferax sp.]